MKISILSFVIIFIFSSSKGQDVLKISGVNKPIKYFSHGFNPRIQVGDTLFLLIHPKDKNYDLTLTNAKGKKLATCMYKSTSPEVPAAFKTAATRANHGRRAPVTKTLVPIGDDCLKQYSASIR
jgi:hypothetical protein